MKKIILLSILTLLSIVGYAVTFNINGINYESLSVNTVQVTGYTITAPQVVIPKTVSDPNTFVKYSVVRIDLFAFTSKGLTSVTLPEGLISIGNTAFFDNNLTSVIIPNSVTTIEYNAFKQNDLTSMDLGTGVTDIGLGAFVDNELTTLILPGSVQTMGNSAFKDNLIKRVTIEDGVGELGINAFQNNPVISVTSHGMVPPSLESSAFVNNGRDVIDLYIPDGTTAAYVLNPGAEWTGFKSVAEASFVIDYITYVVTASNTVSAVNYNTLGGSTVNVPETITVASVTYDVTNVGDEAFKQKGLSDLTLSEGLLSIGNSAFFQNSLTSVTIPNSVTSISYNVFYDNQLSTLDLGTGIELIQNGSFSNNELTSVIIPSSIVALGAGVFHSNNITTVTVRDGVGQLGLSTFLENPVTSVISESIVPPTLNATVFPDRSLISLSIPGGTSGVYVTDVGAEWTGFNPVTENPLLGTSKVDLAEGLSIFNSQTELSISSELIESYDYNIYNSSGVSLMKGDSSEGENISIASLAQGQYILVLLTDHGKVAKRFMK